MDPRSAWRGRRDRLATAADCSARIRRGLGDVAREEWIVRRGHLEYRLQFGPLLKERRFDDGLLEMTHTKDSDGDSRYRLVVRDASKKRTFDSSLYDDAELVDCARWLEASTGFPLRLPR